MNHYTIDVFRHSTTDLATWIESEVQPNVYAVIRLNRFSLGAIGNVQIYERELVSYLKRVSKRVFGNKSFRNRPHGQRLLPNAATLEKAVDGPHLNLLIRKPEDITFADFHQIMAEEWGPIKTQWAERGKNSFWCEERDPGANPIGYSLKEGGQSLLLASLTLFSGRPY